MARLQPKTPPAKKPALLTTLSSSLIIIIKKRSAVQGWERVINTLSVQRPQPHNTNK